MEDNRIEDAVRCFKAYLDIVKDIWVYEALADLHLKQGMKRDAIEPGDILKEAKTTRFRTPRCA